MGIPIETVAKLELLEEAGAEADKFISLGKFDMSNGIANMQMHIYLALGVVLTQPQKLEHAEKIDQIKAVPIEGALEMVYSGQLSDGDSAFALLIAKNYLEKHLCQ